MSTGQASDEREIPEIDNDLSCGFGPEFEHKWWTTEHVLWFIMLVIVIAALCGFFGRGGVEPPHRG